MSICVHMLSRHNWRIYGTSWKRGGPGRPGEHGGYSQRVPARIVLCFLWMWSLYLQLSIVSAYCARCFTLFWLTRRANCSILRVGLHWPQRQAEKEQRDSCGMWHVAWWGMRHAAAHVEHWTEATLMISVRQCKTDKTHFQIVHSLRDFREKIYKTNMKKECETEKKKKREGNLSNQTIL